MKTSVADPDLKYSFGETNFLYNFEYHRMLCLSQARKWHTKFIFLKLKKAQLRRILVRIPIRFFKTGSKIWKPYKLSTRNH